METVSREGKPAAALSVKARAGAVSAAVAERLHIHVDSIGEGNASRAIRDTPWPQREDLVRGVRSNNQVDGIGETRNIRKCMAARVSEVRSNAEQVIVKKLTSVGQSDISGSIVLAPDTALELAAQIMEGNVSLAKAISADKQMAGHLYIETGSEEELARALELLQPAWEEIYRIIDDHDSAVTAATATTTVVTTYDNDG